LAAIEYRTAPRPTPEQLVDLYRSCSLGARRPIHDMAVVEQMLAHADLVVTAWDGDELVGLARTLTDYGYVAYLADLAVRDTHQRCGIGRALIARTRRELGPGAMVVLLAAPSAEDYYPRLGFQRHESAWVLRPGDPLR